MRVTLEDVCEKGASNLKQSDVVSMTGEYPIYGAAGYLGNVDFYHQEKPYVAIVKDGAGIGRTTLHPAKSSVIGTMQYLLPKDNVLPEYLYYVVRHMHLEKYFTGATIPHIYFRDYKNEKFNLDSLDKQAEIVEILGKAELIVLKRRQQLAELDKLIKARFVELFGDPLKNDKSFSTVPGEVLFKLSNGKALPNNKRFTVGVPAYGGNGVSWYTDEILCDYDTIIIGRVGFQSGNVHLAKAPLWVTDNAMYISGINNKECDIRFLCSLMEHLDFKRYQDAGDLKKITQKPFMQMHYLLPPISLQKQYIAFVEQTDKSKVAVQKALDEAQLLFDSLMQKYFQ
jgi:type I restriction-modification system S subunit